MDSKATLLSILDSAAPRLMWSDSRFFFVHCPYNNNLNLYIKYQEPLTYTHVIAQCYSTIKYDA